MSGLTKTALPPGTEDAKFQKGVSHGFLDLKAWGFPATITMKKAERKRVPLVANLGDINRPLRVRAVRVEGREWWAIDPEDTWPGMVMDLRRLGFESMAMGDEVLVRESAPAYEPQMDGPALPTGLKPFPTVNPTIQVRKESYFNSYDPYGEYLDEDDDEDLDEEDDDLEPEDLDIE